MAENNNLVLKKISEINNMHFFIPSFQRGYRWDIMQVEDLLNDIKEYIDNKENNKSFLCLQPVVVYKKDGKDVVIDGQQRLTTIAIIKHFLEMNDRYRIEYEKNGNFLADLLDNITYTTDKLEQELYAVVLEQELYAVVQDNINNRQTHSLDEYHIVLSYLAIVRYFNKLDNKEKYKSDFNKLFSSDDDKYSIQFIWYNVTDEIKDDEKKAIDIFTRLNIGKIPLTDAELIKALFLKKDNFKESEIDKKLHIAYKWDEIEKTLNNDTFWYFISNKDEDEIKKRNRIELILELAIDTQNGKNHELFKEYENKFKQINNENKDNKDNIHNLDNLWQKIEECFMTLKEWYNDNEMYHYVGFLTCSQKYIKDIYNLPKKDKHAYMAKLYDIIWKIIFRKEADDIDSPDKIKNMINELNYNSDNIKEILLFSNIYTTIKMNRPENSKNDTNRMILHRFPFDIYVKESWDIEHISPQTENPLNNIKERRIWFNESYHYLFNNNFILFDNYYNMFINNNNTNDKILNEIKSLLTESNINNILNTDKDCDIFNDDKWNIFYEFMLKSADKLHKYVYLSDDKKDKLGNLVLLPRDINRSYKNKLFGVKRQRIIDDEKNNRFIPIDTKYVFLKYYSSNTKDLWADEDVEAFENIIIDNIKEFLSCKSKNEGDTNEHQ